MNTKALSPVIATVLLISLVVVLAAIVFLWAKAFLPEQLEKNGPIQDRCKDINMIAELDIDTMTVSVLNQGNLPIYGIKIGVKSGFSLSYIEIGGLTEIKNSIKPQTTGDFSIPAEENIGTNDLVIVPILLGKTSGGESKAYVCDIEFAYTIDR